MHMRPPHVATTKGESVRMPTAAQTAAAQQHASSTPVPTAVTEAAQSDSADRTQVPQVPTNTAPKAKGVVIQETAAEKPKEKDSKEAKGKGKEVLIEPENPMKRKTQLQIDEELARKLQEEEEVPLKLKKEKAQLQKDEELAKKLHAQEMAALAEEEAAAKAKQQRSKKTTEKPTKAQVARDKRRMMITFLKSALNVNVQRLQKMNDKAYNRKQFRVIQKKEKKKR